MFLVLKLSLRPYAGVPLTLSNCIIYFNPNTKKKTNSWYPLEAPNVPIFSLRLIRIRLAKRL